MDKEASVDDTCLKFDELLSHSRSAIPRDCVRFSEKDKPWMTPVLKSLINKRWAAFRSKNWTLYTHYKKKVKKEISNAKSTGSERQSQSPRGLENVVRHQGLKYQCSKPHSWWEENPKRDVVLYWKLRELSANTVGHHHHLPDDGLLCWPKVLVTSNLSLIHI